MPRNVTITFDDGTTHLYQGVPDDATTEQVTARAQQDFAGKAITGLDGGLEKTPMERAERTAKVAGSGFARGAAGLPALGVDVGNLIGDNTPVPLLKGLNWLTEKLVGKNPEGMPASSAVGKFGTQPETPGEKYLASTMEGVGGAALGPGILTAPVRTLVTGAASGAGAELGGQLGDNNPLARLLGGVAGGVTGGWLSSLPGRLRPQSADLAKEVMENLDPAMLKAAQTFQAQSKAQGIDMDLAQALEAVGAPASNLATLRDVLANSKHGNAVQRVGREQQGQLERLADTTAGGLPGPVVSRNVAADWTQEAATGAISAVKEERSELWKSTFDNAKATLKATEGAAFAQASKEVKAARGRLIQLQNDLAGAKASDEAAVAALNAKAEEAAQLINRLREFTLPRGSAAGNTGRMVDLPKRGESIMFDQIGRETRGELAGLQAPPKVPLAPSIETLNLESQIPGATSAAAAAEKAAGKASARLRMVDEVPEQVIGRIASGLDREIAKAPNTGKAKLLQGLRDSLYFEGKPVQDAEALNEILKSQNARLADSNLATNGVDAGAVKWMRQQIENTRKQLGAASQPYRKANEAFSTFTDEVVDPLKKSVVGRVAGRTGAKADLEAPATRLEGIFSGADPQVQASDIPKLFNELAKVDKNAVPAAAKEFIRRRMQEAFQSMPGETVPGAASSWNSAAKLQASLFGNQRQWEAMRQMTAGIARSYDLPEKDLVRGMENFMQITKGLASRPAKYGGLNWDDVAKTGGRSKLADAARIWSFMPANQVARRIEDATLAKTFQEFDRVLTTPEGADLLIALSKTPTMSNKALTLLATFSSAPATTQPDQQ